MPSQLLFARGFLVLCTAVIFVSCTGKSKVPSIPDLPDATGMPDAESSAAVTFPLALGQNETTLGIFRLRIDPQTLSHTEEVLTLPRGASGPNTQADVITTDLAGLASVEGFPVGDLFDATGLALDAAGNLVIEYDHEHPFPTPDDGLELGQPMYTPNDLTKRLDLVYTGRIVFLVERDTTRHTETFFGTSGLIKPNPEAVHRPDGYLHTPVTGTDNDIIFDDIDNNDFTLFLGSDDDPIDWQDTDTFPYMLLKKDDDEGNYQSQSNIDGWARTFIDEGWTGFDVIYHGEEVAGSVTIDKDWLAEAEGGEWVIDLAILAKWADPKGEKLDPPATNVDRWGPTGNPDDEDRFAYRFPHAALDVSRITLDPTLDTVNGRRIVFVDETTNGTGNLPTILVRDWDSEGTEHTGSPVHLRTLSNVDAIPDGAAGEPTGAIHCPAISSTEFSLTFDNAGTGLPDEEYEFSGTLTNHNGFSNDITDLAPAMIRMIDPENSLANQTTWYGLNGVVPDADPLEVDPDNAMEKITYQAVWVRANNAPLITSVVLPNDPEFEEIVEFELRTNGVYPDPAPDDVYSVHWEFEDPSKGCWGDPCSAEDVINGTAADLPSEQMTFLTQSGEVSGRVWIQADAAGLYESEKFEFTIDIGPGVNTPENWKTARINRFDDYDPQDSFTSLTAIPTDASTFNQLPCCAGCRDFMGWQGLAAVVYLDPLGDVRSQGDPEECPVTTPQAIRLEIFSSKDTRNERSDCTPPANREPIYSEVVIPNSTLGSDDVLDTDIAANEDGILVSVLVDEGGGSVTAYSRLVAYPTTSCDTAAMSAIRSDTSAAGTQIRCVLRDNGTDNDAVVVYTSTNDAVRVLRAPSVTRTGTPTFGLSPAEADITGSNDGLWPVVTPAEGNKLIVAYVDDAQDAIAIALENSVGGTWATPYFLPSSENASELAIAQLGDAGAQDPPRIGVAFRRGSFSTANLGLAMTRPDQDPGDSDFPADGDAWHEPVFLDEASTPNSFGHHPDIQWIHGLPAIVAGVITDTTNSVGFLKAYRAADANPEDSWQQPETWLTESFSSERGSVGDDPVVGLGLRPTVAAQEERGNLYYFIGNHEDNDPSIFGEGDGMVNIKFNLSAWD